MAAGRIGERWTRLPGSLERWIAAFVILVCTSVIGLELSHEQNERAIELASDKVAAVNLAGSLARQAEDTIELANVAIAGVIQRIEASAGSKVGGDVLTSIVESALPRLARMGPVEDDRSVH